MGSAKFVLLAIRLGLFQACLGALSVLTLGIFNRLLIEEFAVPAALTALALGCQQLVAFTRVWFGQRSDRCRWRGLRRTPFIIGGAAAFCALTWIAGRMVLWIAAASMLDDTSAVITRGLLLAVVFLLYGIAISASSTPFAALLVDVSTEKQRPVLVSIVWSMLMLGIVVGAILLSSFLGSSCASSELTDVIAGVKRLIAIAPMVIFALVLIAIAGVEPRLTNSKVGQAQSNDQEISLGASWTILRASPQVGYFFAVLSLFTFSLFLQEAVLEPYGGAIFAMDVCATTRLNAIWGIGTLLGIATTGFLFVPRLGAQRTALLGGLLSAVFVLLIVVAGGMNSEPLFKGALFLFGAAAGISTNASLTLMLGLTSPLMAGTFIGVWGLAQAYARGLATIGGGALLSFFGQFSGSQNSFSAYAGVFIVQAIGLLIAGVMLLRVDTNLFQRKVEQALTSVLSSELD
ncbi:MAG: BCD family MFS transporter [Synechococcus sp.]|uniref:BCD family MFS transporter n=1 Tax=Synechococcus sp. BMK-MC-1 TaxID=1442551 RepID=UPI0016468B5F|nr:BCD family MFS transporter [Synechococcus sp. BMK-MC-1]QNI67571.1 major facilitator superfamily protein/ PucC-like protein [Synechococcus sp. BMK-MC-1]